MPRQEWFPSLCSEKPNKFSVSITEVVAHAWSDAPRRFDIKPRVNRLVPSLIDEDWTQQAFSPGCGCSTTLGLGMADAFKPKASSTRVVVAVDRCIMAMFVQECAESFFFLVLYRKMWRFAIELYARWTAGEAKDGWLAQARVFKEWNE